jgi:hypothetical protein
MIDAWRRDFRRDFPFLVVELAAYGGTDETSVQRSADPLPRFRLDQVVGFPVCQLIQFHTLTDLYLPLSTLEPNHQSTMQHDGVTPSGALPPVTTTLTGIASAVDLGDDGKLPYTPPTSRHGGVRRCF